MMNECMVHCIVTHSLHLHLWGEDHNISLWNNCVVGVTHHAFLHDLIALVTFKHNACTRKLTLNPPLFLFAWELNKEKDELGKKQKLHPLHGVWSTRTIKEEGAGVARIAACLWSRRRRRRRLAVFGFEKNHGTAAASWKKAPPAQIGPTAAAAAAASTTALRRRVCESVQLESVSWVDTENRDSEQAREREGENEKKGKLELGCVTVGALVAMNGRELYLTWS